MTAVLYASTACPVDVYSEENGGGRGDGQAEVDGSDFGYCGGGDCERLIWFSSFWGSISINLHSVNNSPVIVR